MVFGAGGIGLNIVQAAQLAGAHPIVALDLYDNRLALAKRLGATHTINGATEDAESAIRRVLPEQGVDCFIDNTGIPAVIELGYRLTKPQGRVTLVGVPRKGNNVSLYSLPLHFGKIISGSHGGEAIPNEDIPRYMRLAKAGRLSLSELITAEYDLDHINEAVEDMRRGRTAGRCLVRLAD